MYTTYHLSSAEEITMDILDSIKKAYKSRPIVITVEEEMDATDYLMSSPVNKVMLDKSIEQLNNGNTVLVKSDDL